jgi:hypothetical protein
MGDNIDKSARAGAREYYFNGDFDLTLRGAPTLLDGDDPTFVHEMANHFLFAGEKEDTVILRAPLLPEFLEHIASKGLDLPGTLVHPRYTPSAAFTPFGWNPHAESLNARYARPSTHPPLEAVREANARAFSHAFEAKQGRAFGTLVASVGEIVAWMDAHPSASGWVAKGEHGHAGTANRRLPSQELSGAERHDLEVLLAGNGRAALEPWHERLEDMAMNFQVGADGAVEDFRGHEMLTSRIGAFLGVKVTPDRLPPEPWREPLRAAAEPLARALADIGYRGPVGVDAYTFRTEGGVSLRPYVDVNARLSMALPAHSLARRLPGRIVLWTWSKPKKLTLPDTYAELGRRLGADDYDPASRSGILAASPLRVASASGPETFRPKRVSFALVARDEAELVRLRERFQMALGRA